MTTSQDRMKAALSSISGIEIPGGCMDCDARQEFADLGGGVFGVEVRHDATCPTYRAMGGGEGR